MWYHVRTLHLPHLDRIGSRRSAGTVWALLPRVFEACMQPANSALCTMVRALLQTSASNQHIPPAEVVAHIAVCDLCRGALALLATTMFASAPHPLPTSCADCQAVLDAFIDLEHATELIQAMQAYPQAGWHV